MSRRLQSIQITNVKAIESMTIRAGAVTVIAGENGAGKTSVLDAIASVFEGGHDPALIRHGAERAEVVLTLDDGVTIRKRITQKDSTLEVRTEDGGIVKAPASYVKRLAESFAFDPIGLLDAKPKDRAAWLLKNGNITFTAAEVNTAIGAPAVKGMIDLEKLESIRLAKYTERTDANRRLRDLDGAIREQKAMLPPAVETDWVEAQELIETALAAKRSALDAMRQEVQTAEHAQIEGVKAKAQQQIDEIRQKLAEDIQEINRKADSLLAAESETINAEIANLSAELAGARAKAEEQQRAAGVRAVIERNEKQYKEHLTLEGALTRTIAALDELKLSKLRELPIEGLDIRDGDIYVNGTQFDHLNTQAQIFTVIQAANLALGELPLMVLDRAESLDDERFAALAAAVEEAGLQLIAARVVEGPLKVEVAA